MQTSETPLEVAQRRVVEAKARMKHQAARVPDAARRGIDTTQPKATLTVFECALRLMLEDVA